MDTGYSQDYDTMPQWRLSFFGLRFEDDDLERRFRLNSLQQWLTGIRAGFLIMLISALLPGFQFGFTEQLGFPATQPAWHLSIAITCLLPLAALILSYFPALYRTLHAPIATGILITFSVVLTHWESAHQLSASFTITAFALLMLWLYTLARISFPITLISGVGVTLLFAFHVLNRPLAGENALPEVLVLLVGLNLMGLLGRYGGERVSRISFMRQHRLFELASLDELTGIMNRRQIRRTGEYEFSRAQRYETHYSVMLLDIDNFKEINDRFGHCAGDLALKSLAEWLGKNLREADICGRYGGDEFLVLLPGAWLMDAEDVAQRVLTYVNRRQVRLEAEEFAIRISIGIASVDKSTADFEALIHEADLALYDAKAKGGNWIMVRDKSVLAI